MWIVAVLSFLLTDSMLSSPFNILSLATPMDPMLDSHCSMMQVGEEQKTT